MLKSIANLHKLCFPHRPWSENDFADLKKSGCEIVASGNGFIVWRCVADECEIITIGVAPNARGTGIADAMLALMENEILKASGIQPKLPPLGGSSIQHKIFLEVAADNRPARALYEKHGYKQIGTRPKYYDNTDAIVMEKKL